MCLSQDLIKKRTLIAYIITRLLDTPFWAIYNLFIIILFKQAGAASYQIALMVALKPLVSIFSSYWASFTTNRYFFIKKSILYGRFLAYLPFLLFPFIDSTWFFICCYGSYILMQVGMNPAWMELLRRNVPEIERNRVFSIMQTVGYLGGGLLPFLFGWILDGFTDSWRYIFPILALLALPAYFVQRRMVVQPLADENSRNQSTFLLSPWQKSWQILKEKKDFAKFQVGFFFLGAGLMILQPVIPKFFVEFLNLSFTEMALAVALCKGVGFALSSAYWLKLIKQFDIFVITISVAILASLFPLLLLSSQINILWLYFSYLIYGAMQAGYEMSWNLSGPIFAKETNSAAYSTVNILSVAVRGCFVPFLSTLILENSGAVVVALAAVSLCTFSHLFLFFSGKKEKMEQTT